MAGNILVYRDEDLNQLEEAALARIIPISAASPLHHTLNPLYDQGKVEKEKVGTCSKFLHRLGFEEFYSLQVWRAAVAELLGTAVLVFMIDTIVISTYETSIKTPNIIIAICTAIFVTIILLATASVSGGHVNPAISLAAASAGLISFSRAVVYMIAQCIGAIIGALALQSVVDKSISSKFSLGGCTLTVITPGPDGPVVFGIETSQAFCLEIICSFVFLFPALMAFDGRQYKVFGPIVVFPIIGIVIGLVVFVSTTVTTAKGYSGAGCNPARCFGPAIVRGGHLWDGHWVFWAGPFIGCLAFHLYTLIIPKEHFKPRLSKSV